MSLVVRTTIAAAVASLMLAGSALAQTSSPAPAMGATAKPARSAASIECSKQADAKGLHGKARKKFRSECRKGAAKPQ